MSYEKQTWNTGDIITAEKLNHLEDGVGSGDLFYIVTFSDVSKEGSTSYVSDKTYAQIKAAYDAGKIIIGRYASGGYFKTYVDVREDREGDGGFEFTNIGIVLEDTGTVGIAISRIEYDVFTITTNDEMTNMIYSKKL